MVLELVPESIAGLARLPVLVWLPVLVQHWVQGWAQGQEEREKKPPVAEPSGGHRPHGPKPEPRLLPHWLQELEWAPALLKREHLSQHPSVPAMVPASTRGWAWAPAAETPQPFVRTS